MGKPTPRIACHLWEPFNHVGHAYRRGDQTVHCPGRNWPGMPWVSPKPNRAQQRAAVIAAWRGDRVSGSEAQSIRSVIHRLVDVLGPALTGTVAGLEGAAPVKTWMVRPPGVEQEAKLRIAHEIVQMISANESPEIALIWMCGMNPHLGDKNPAMEIGQGNGRDVLAAARAYVTDPMIT